MRMKAVDSYLQSDSTRELFALLYGESEVERQTERYKHAAAGYGRKFGDVEFEFFSSPGRTEIAGNHTDHNGGRVMTASIQLDCVAAAGKNGSDTVRIFSEMYQQHITTSIHDLCQTEETAGTLPLVKGILAGFLQKGYQVGGFNAYITSDVLPAAGISSSAAFEMLLCSILDTLFNDRKLDAVTYAKIGQFAENQYWNKQSGLQDQMACATGGLIGIDFHDVNEPLVEQLDFSFDRIGCDLVIVNTGKGHADLNAEYTGIPSEMKQAASCLGKTLLAEAGLPQLLENLEQVRREAGDRAVLRALHFFTEDARVERQIDAVKNGRYDEFLQLIRASGESSWKWLQNCYSTQNSREQSIPVALALTELYLEPLPMGACRVHGGGFAGVIAVVLPKQYTDGYIRYMEGYIGKGCAFRAGIRSHGAIRLALKDV